MRRAGAETADTAGKWNLPDELPVRENVSLQVSGCVCGVCIRYAYVCFCPAALIIGPAEEEATIKGKVK